MAVILAVLVLTVVVRLLKDVERTIIGEGVTVVLYIVTNWVTVANRRRVFVLVADIVVASVAVAAQAH